MNQYNTRESIQKVLTCALVKIPFISWTMQWINSTTATLNRSLQPLGVRKFTLLFLSLLSQMLTNLIFSIIVAKEICNQMTYLISSLCMILYVFFAKKARTTKRNQIFIRPKTVISLSKNVTAYVESGGCLVSCNNTDVPSTDQQHRWWLDHAAIRCTCSTVVYK